MMHHDWFSTWVAHVFRRRMWLAPLYTDYTGPTGLIGKGAASNDGGGAPGAGFKCATVFAGDENLGTINVGAFDQNGFGGVNPADISVWIRDAFAFPSAFYGRSDFNCTRTINPADLTLLLQTSFGSGSTRSALAYCQ